MPGQAPWARAPAGARPYRNPCGRQTRTVDSAHPVLHQRSRLTLARWTQPDRCHPGISLHDGFGAHIQHRQTVAVHQHQRWRVADPVLRGAWPARWLEILAGRFQRHWPGPRKAQRLVVDGIRTTAFAPARGQNLGIRPIRRWGCDHQNHSRRKRGPASGPATRLIHTATRPAASQTNSTCWGNSSALARRSDFFNGMGGRWSILSQLMVHRGKRACKAYIFPQVVLQRHPAR